MRKLGGRLFGKQPQQQASTQQQSRTAYWQNPASHTEVYPHRSGGVSPATHSIYGSSEQNAPYAPYNGNPEFVAEHRPSYESPYVSETGNEREKHASYCNVNNPSGTFQQENNSKNPYYTTSEDAYLDSQENNNTRHGSPYGWPYDGYDGHMDIYHHGGHDHGHGHMHGPGGGHGHSHGHMHGGYGPGYLHGPGGGYGHGHMHGPGGGYGHGHMHGPGSGHGHGHMHGPGGGYGHGHMHGPGGGYGPGYLYGPGGTWSRESD